MSFLDFDPIYMIYFLAAASAVLFAEGVYLLFFSASSYRKGINRRLQLLDEQANRENVLVALRRERGLTGGGDYRLPLVSLNRLILQSGLSIGLSRLAMVVGGVAALVFVAMLVLRGEPLEALGLALLCGVVLPYVGLRMLRSRRQKQFGAQFPDALDVIVRSLRAGHPVPVAIAMVGRELPDPIGSEFGVVADEVTYGADLETALRNLYFRVGQDDLPLFVTAVAIQGSTGGNLSEILENLSAVIRMRFKMRRKIKALASEGRASAMILSSLPIAIFLIIQLVAPDFYGRVWDETLTKIALGAAATWMAVGNFIMYRLVNFKI
jgi:tight adherence protein B